MESDSKLNLSRTEWDHVDYVHSGDAAAHNVRQALADAVRTQCMSDVPFGLLLSGGLDSAVVAVLLKPILEELGQVRGVPGKKSVWRFFRGFQVLSSLVNMKFGAT